MSFRVSSPADAPRYVTIAQDFRHQIRSGELKAGDRLPSFPVMRSRYGVSQATLERAHTLLQQEGLIVRVQGKGVFVAAPKSSQQTGVIGFTGVAFDVRNDFPYWAHLTEGIQKAARQTGQQILLLNDGASWKETENKIDGALISERLDLTLLSQMPETLPCVSLMVPVKGVALVGSDDYQGVYAATEHLLALGHRRIACLMYADDLLSEPRLSGYRDALRAAGITPDPRHFREPLGDSGALFIVRGHRAMQEWLQQDWDETGCTALLAQNDEAAIGVIRALKEAGIAVPVQVSVVGFDGTEVGEYVTPRLTTIEVPLMQIGALGVETLLRQIQTGRRDVSVTLLPTRLKVRESTAPPPLYGRRRYV